MPQAQLGHELLQSIAALALAKFKFYGRKGFIVIILGVQMVPLTALIIPLYILLSKAHQVDRLSGVIVTYLTFVLPFCIWTLRGFVNGVLDAVRSLGARRAHAADRVLEQRVAGEDVALDEEREHALGVARRGQRAHLDLRRVGHGRRVLPERRPRPARNSSPPAESPGALSWMRNQISSSRQSATPRRDKGISSRRFASRKKSSSKITLTGSAAQPARSTRSRSRSFSLTIGN